MVEYVKYKGKELPVRITYTVLAGLKKKGINIADIDEDISKLHDVFFLSYQSGCKAEGLIAQIKEDEIDDVLDECYLEFLSLIPSFFSQESGEVDEKKN